MNDLCKCSSHTVKLHLQSDVNKAVSPDSHQFTNGSNLTHSSLSTFSLGNQIRPFLHYTAHRTSNWTTYCFHTPNLAIPWGHGRRDITFTDHKTNPTRVLILHTRVTDQQLSIHDLKNTENHSNKIQQTWQYAKTAQIKIFCILIHCLNNHVEKTRFIQSWKTRINFFLLLFKCNLIKV